MSNANQPRAVGGRRKYDRFPPVLSERSLVPIGIVCGIMAVVVGATWWLASTYSEIQDVGRRLGRIEATLVQTMDDGLSKRDFDVWLSVFKQANGTLSVPERMK
jgi:hypothetical protein